MPTPAVNNVLRSNPYKYALDQFTKSSTAAAYGLRRLRTGYTGYGIRVRDDVGSETDIGFIGENLNTAGLLSWLGRNQVSAIPLGVDGGSGVSTGWTSGASNGGVGTASISDSSQRFDLTGGTQTFSGYGAYINNKSTVAGNIFTISVKYKKTTTLGSSRVLMGIDWYNGSTYLSTSSVYTNVDTTEYITIQNTFLAPLNTTIAKIFIRIDSNGVIGNTGSAWFKDASVTISNQSAYVTTIYDQSGNGNHAVQVTPSNQPRIVNAGVIDVDASGKPRIVFADGSDRLLASGMSIQNIFSASYVGNSLNTGAGIRIVTLTSDTPASNTMVMPSSDDTIPPNLVMGERFPNAYNMAIIGNTSGYLTTPQILTYKRLSTTYQEAYKNGANKVTNTQTTSTFNITRIYLGADNVTGTHFLQEYVVFNSPLTDSQRQRLERSQSKYFGIGVA